MHDEPPDWHTHAACLGYPSEWWFADGHSTGRDGYSQARTICKGCPVRQDCLDWATGVDPDSGGARERFGMWGGLSPRERQHLRPGPGGRPRTPISHGTEAHVAYVQLRKFYRREVVQ